MFIEEKAVLTGLKDRAIGTLFQEAQLPIKRAASFGNSPFHFYKKIFKPACRGRFPHFQIIVYRTNVQSPLSSMVLPPQSYLM